MNWNNSPIYSMLGKHGIHGTNINVKGTLFVEIKGDIRNCATIVANLRNYQSGSTEKYLETTRRSNLPSRVSYEENTKQISSKMLISWYRFEVIFICYQKSKAISMFTLREIIKKIRHFGFLGNIVWICLKLSVYLLDNQIVCVLQDSVYDKGSSKNGSFITCSRSLVKQLNFLTDFVKEKTMLNVNRCQTRHLHYRLDFLPHPSYIHRNHLLKQIGKLCFLTFHCTRITCPGKSSNGGESERTTITMMKHYDETNLLCLSSTQEYGGEIQKQVLEYFSGYECKRVLNDIIDPKYHDMFSNDFTRYSEVYVFPIFRRNHLEYSFKQILDGTQYLSSEIMRFEHHRLSTFANYEVIDSPSALLMAKAGWYATGNENETKTFCCLVVNRVWRRDDDPLVVHKNFQPNCQFIQGGNLGQVAIQEDQIQQITGSNAYLETTGDPYRESSVLQDTEVFEKSQDCNSDADASFSEILNNPQDWKLRSPMSCVKDRSEESINSHLNVIDQHSQLIQRTRQMTIDSRHISSCSWTIDCPSRTSSSTNPASNNSQDNVENYQRRNENQIVIGNNVPDNTSTTHGVIENQEKIKDQSLYSHTGDKGNAEDRPKNNAYYHELELKPLVIGKPKHAEYATVGVRASSFSGFPIGSGKTPKEFAIGGFYYRGFGDRTACFQCGINLQRWSPEDDVFVEHARHNPYCQYVRQLKGDDFVRLVHMVTQTPEVTEDQDNIVKNLREMGFEENEISAAIARTSSNNGQLTLQKALDNVLHSKNTQSNPISDLSHNRSIENSENKTAESASHNDSIASGIDTKCSNLVTSTEDQFLCKICMDERVGVAFSPCGHIATCFNCAKPLRTCPMCRAVVIEKITTEI